MTDHLKTALEKISRIADRQKAYFEPHDAIAILQAFSNFETMRKLLRDDLRQALNTLKGFLPEQDTETIEVNNKVKELVEMLQSPIKSI